LAHLLLAGYFGCGNLGDDAILLGFAEGLSKDPIDLTVLSGFPEETYRNYGLSSVPRMDQGKIGEALEKCDALVFPGGSIFQDATSVRSVGYYANLVKRAKKAGKRVIMVGQGVGPLTTFFGKRIAASAFNMADVIVVRDPASMTTLKSLGVTRPMRVGGDPAFLLPVKPQPEDTQNFAIGDMKSVGIAPRPYGKDKKAMVELFGGLARLLFQAKLMPVLIEMDRNMDGPLLDEISKQQGGKIPTIKKLQTPMQLQGRMARMDSVIAMRLHAGILAAAANVPPLMVSYDPKVTAFAKALDLGSAPSVDTLTPQRLFELFQSFSKDRDRNMKVLQRKREELISAAEMNVQAVRECLRNTVQR
jgi:polysaccharide pyruvyl transferase CsaB